jgi:hypothetical protein
MNLDLVPSPVAPPGFPFLENHVRARLGISKDDIRELRQTRTASDEWRLSKKRVWLSPAAVQKIAAAKGVALDHLPPASPAANADDGGAVKTELPKKTAPKSEPVKLRVIRPTKNPHIVLACGEQDDLRCPRKPLRLRVKNSETFRPGLTVTAQLVAGYTDLFDLVGPAPRRMTFLPLQP